MTCYLVCLDEPLGNGTPVGSGRHYLGYTSGRIVDRLDLHAASRGARILAAANARGISWTLVRTWPGATLEAERMLKHRRPPIGTGPDRISRGGHGLTRLCPRCRPTTRRGLRVLASDGRVLWERRKLNLPRTRFAT